MASTSHPDSGYSNPVRLAVATRESSQRPVNADAGPSKFTERDTLLRAKKRNDEVRRKGEMWADKLMEETVDRETFKRALRYIHPSQYDQITHERHLNSLCSYPLCSNPPAAPFKPGKRFRISTTNRSITEVDGNKEDGFCSKACTVRSRWVYERLEEAGSVLARGKSWTIELVEDLDLHTTGQSTSLRTETAGRSPLPQEQSQRGSSAPTLAESMPSTLSPPPPMGRAAATRNTIKPDPQLPLDLMGDLTIHERPTASTADPPSLVPVTAPPTSTSAQTNSTSVQSSNSSTPSKRAPNAILGEQSKLAQTVLKASKAINPEPQINPDSEDEGEHAEVEWERQVGLDWGGGSEGEEDAWAAMREAREIADEGDGQ